MGRKFEDIPAASMLFTLQSLMQEEDIEIIGGNDALLAAPTGLAAADSLQQLVNLSPDALGFELNPLVGCSL